MGLKYLKNDKINELETNIDINIDLYAKGIALTEEKDYLESNLPTVKLELLPKETGNNNDFENSKTVYEKLKHLSPLEASDERIWIGMTHQSEIMKYIISRWNINEESSKGTIKDRFFSHPMRNSVSRLWWYGYVSYNDNFKDPYTLTELLIRNQDIAVGIMERNYSRNRNFVQKLLLALHEWTEYDNNPFPKTEDFRKVAKGINRMSAITLVDLIEIKDFKEVISRYCEKQTPFKSPSVL